MIKYVNGICLPLVIALCFVSCSTESSSSQNSAQSPVDTPSEDAPESASFDSASTGQSDSVASKSEPGLIDSEDGNLPDSAVETRPSKEDEAQMANGVEERRSSESALAKGDINFDDLKFDLEKDAPFESSMITEGLKQLDGRDVTLRGYILPSTLFSETNISQFVLVRDNQECCFGPGAALYDCVMVQMVDGNTTDFVTRPVTVAGRFVIDTESYRYPPGLSPNGATHMAIFRIEGLNVE